MHVTNQTRVTEILLLGFQDLLHFKMLFLFSLPVFLIVTIFGNILIIWLVASNSSLQSPMYFFLTQLSISDLLVTTNIVPNTLYIIFNEGGTMSLSGCIVQFYFFACSEASECFLLTLMAYDRYLAICNPLRYSMLMNPLVCVTFAIISWLLSFSLELILLISTMFLQFCGTNVIDHFFCDLVPLLKLSCSDTTFFEMEVLIMSVPCCFIPLLSIAVFYVYIVKAAIRISTINGKSKVFSTCSSHLMVVSIFYGSLIGIYMLPTKGKSMTVNKIVSLLYTVVTPMINPIIYSLRNSDIKKVLKKKKACCHYNIGMGIVRIRILLQI
ncbi:olfactory receptor 10A7-like [Pelobates fuscus]|uniref:olfactory receptor 10A7-like n=1 Tax=Pelobates fuscus TaxID=191477 RepID=UPI002FE49E28